MLSFRHKALPTCGATLPLVLAAWLLFPGIHGGQAEEVAAPAVGQPRQLFPQPGRASDRAGISAEIEERRAAASVPPPPQEVPQEEPQEARRALPPLPPKKPALSVAATAAQAGREEEERASREGSLPAASPVRRAKPLSAPERIASLSWRPEGEGGRGASSAAASHPEGTHVEAPELHVTDPGDLGSIRHLVRQALEDEQEAVQKEPAERYLPAAVIAGQGAEAPPLAPAFVLPRPLDLRRWDGADFIEEQRRLSASIAERVNQGRSPGAQVLELSGLYASKGLSHEALSLLADLDEAALLPRQRREAWALREVLQVWQAPEEEQDLRLLGEPAYADWPDWALWTAYSYASRRQWEAAGELAGEGLQRLQAYPAVVRVPLLIALAEALLMTRGDVTLADDALRGLEGENLEHADRAAFRYLTALAAEAHGQTRHAFESYLAAARGEGPYAQKARIAVVDVGLSSAQMSLEEGEALLSDAYNLWRGDRLEIEVLKRLAALRLELADDVGVLAALARLALAFPSEPIAEQALRNARPLLDDIYRVPQREQRSIAQRIEEHEALRHAFSDHPFFVSYRQAFADDLSVAGLKAAAAREYALLSEDAPEAQREAYALKRVATLLEAGAEASARDVLEAMPQPRNPELAQQWRRLQARVVATSDQAQPLDEQGRADAGVEALLLRAEAAWRARRWPEVVQIYDIARREYPERFGETELLRLLIASYRQGERELFVEVVRDHEELASRTEWHALAGMLIDKPPPLNPLGAAEARSVIDQAEDVRDLVRRALRLPQV